MEFPSTADNGGRQSWQPLEFSCNRCKLLSRGMPIKRDPSATSKIPSVLDSIDRERDRAESEM